jgi:DNA-directed RNA polymerase beta subunit
MKIDEENEINLPNRKEFLEDNKNNKFNKVAIFDINGFGNINHYYGYDFGEKVLKLISLRLENKFLNSKIYYLGADIFASASSEDISKDKLIIRHTVEPINDTNTTIVVLNEHDVLEHYRMDLLEKNLLNTQIPTNKLKIIARLIGALNTDGHLEMRSITNSDNNNIYYQASFNLGEEYDVYQVADDIKNLGFENVSIRRSINKFEDKHSGRVTTSTTWEVSKSGSFAYFMYLMGAFAGKKTEMARQLPEWLVNAELSIKREFLSAFQGGDGSRLSYQKNDKTFKPNLGVTIQTSCNDYLNYTISYMNQIVTMFDEFNITCRIKTVSIKDNKTQVQLVFEKSSGNLLQYANIINYTYCEEKRRASAPIIEHLKIREQNKINRDANYDYIINNYKTEKMCTLLENTNLTERQIRKVISNFKNGLVQSTRFTTDIIYDSFIRENISDNGCISIPIESITEIEPELVYDFTTRSDNHSFVASSFVVSNCPAETPEGATVGIVKSISYMAHVTIHSNSLSLYDYVNPHIIQVADLKPADLYNKVKVFINGCWMGISNEPEQLFNMLKDMKYKGIINIYTSIVFDYKVREIKVCNDSGRMTRPLLRVKNNNLVLTNDIISELKAGKINWDDLFTNCKASEAILEYIDPEEQSFSLIATVPKDMIKQDYIK